MAAERDCPDNGVRELASHDLFDRVAGDAAARCHAARERPQGDLAVVEAELPKTEQAIAPGAVEVWWTPGTTRRRPLMRCVIYLRVSTSQQADRAPLIRLAFELYARRRRDGVEYPGQHDPLTDAATFQRVQDLLAARSARGTRERKHHHYLKGSLYCGVCGRRLSCQFRKGRYLYFFCLGQKDGGVSVCREPYVPADRLEDAVAKLYQRLQLPDSVGERLIADIKPRLSPANTATPANASSRPASSPTSTANAASCSTPTTPTPST